MTHMANNIAIRHPVDSSTSKVLSTERPTKLNFGSRPLLQLAVDTTDLEQAIKDITEIGTPLILEEGLRAVEVLKSRFPESQYLADLKIMDAGRLEAERAFRRGADLVTVLGLADDQTIRGALEAAKEFGGQIMVDLINVPDVVTRVQQLESLGVQLVCLHTAYDIQGNGTDPMASVSLVRKKTRCRLAVAGGLKLQHVDRAVRSGADILVFGGFLANDLAPDQLAQEIIARLEQTERCDAPEKQFQEIALQVVDEIERCLKSVLPEEIEGAIETIDRAQRIFVIGAGRTGLAMQAFAMRLMHLGKQVHWVGDVSTPAITEDDLLVIGSGSGSTASLQATASRAKQIGAQVLLFTIQPDSPIGQLADGVVRVPAPSPKVEGKATAVDSVQPMGSLFEQSLFLLCDTLILSLMQNEGGSSSEAMFARHANLE